MKTYDEISQRVLERRDEYITGQKARRKKLTAVTSVVASVAIVAVIGVGVSGNIGFELPSEGAEVTGNKLAELIETTDPANQQEILTEKPTETTFFAITQDVPQTTAPVATTVTGAETMVMPHWDDLIICEKFREIKVGDITYSSQTDEIEDEHILNFISESEMTGYDIYEDKTYTEKGKVYSIKHISTECAVAVQIGADKTYYVFINSWYFPETLGDFIDDLDLRNTVVFGDVYYDVYEYSKTYSKHTRRTYENVDDSVIWDMLLTDTSLKNVEYNRPYDRISVETDLPLLGYKNISFSVTTDGYIITNILDVQKCFFVGKDKTDAFAKYLEDNVAFKEDTEVYEYNSDGSIPGKTCTTPAVPPGADINTSANAGKLPQGEGENLVVATTEFVLE